MSDLQAQIDAKQKRAERFGTQYDLTEKDKQALRAARFADSTASSATPAGNKSLDDLIKEERSQRKASVAKKPQNSKKPTQKPRQQAAVNARQPAARQPTTRQPARSQQRQPLRQQQQQRPRQPLQQRQPLRQQPLQQRQPLRQQPLQQQRQAKGGLRQQNTLPPPRRKAGGNVGSRAAAAPPKPTLQKRRGLPLQKTAKKVNKKDYIALIDPSEALRQQQRQNRFSAA